MSEIVVSLSAEQLERLRERARQAGVSPEECARTALEKWLGQPTQEPPRGIRTLSPEEAAFIRQQLASAPPRPPCPEVKRPTIHYTQLEDFPPDDPLYNEWNTCRRELPRLIAEGHEGKFVLVKGAEIIGLYPSYLEANAEGCRRFLTEPFLIHEIQTEIPLLRLSLLALSCLS